MAKPKAKSRPQVPATTQEKSRLEKFASPWLISAALVVVTLAVYSSTAGFNFVDYDDSDYVKANAHVQAGLTVDNLLWAFRTGHASNWHPVTWVSHMLDCQLFGIHPSGPHVVNVVFHAVNSMLLFLVFRRMTGATMRSACLAGIFALHPLHVESVAWISERKDVLSTLFLLLTLGAYARGLEGQRGGVRVSALRQPGDGVADNSTLRGLNLLAALVFFALGLASKPMLVTLPFVLLLLDFWPLNRVDPTRWFSRCNLRLLLEKIPFFALSAASCVITYIMQRRGGAVSTSLSLGARVANALVSYVRYLGKFFWPDSLSVLYPHPGQWPLSLVLLSSLLLAGIFVAVLVLARPKPYLAVGWLWFFGTLVPVIGLVQVGIQSMADRYMYVPMIGLLIPVVWGSFDFLGVRSWGPRLLGIGYGFVLAACEILTMNQTQYWRDSEALFRRAVQVTKNNYLAYNNLGFYLSNQGKVTEAMQNYEKSLEINPNYEDALNNMGYALAGQKQYAKALPRYEAALRVRPGQVEVHNNLGNALSELGRLDEAIQHYQFVLEQKPEHADANNNLGIALAMKGRLDEAIPLFRNAIRFKPDYASAHSNLGNALAAQHKIEEAIHEYREALRLKPDEPQAHNNLGNALAEQGKLDEAIGYYNSALKLNADNPEAHFNLGIALARKGRQEEAASHFGAALKLKPDYVEAKRALESMGIKSNSR